MDRKAQGISQEQEEMAINAIENNLENYGDKLIVINSTFKTKHIDRSDGKHKNKPPHLVERRRSINFYGEKIINTLQSKFGRLEWW